MAKVLACPACGYKHPLDLLVGLDTFMCKECGKKLAVPGEAAQFTKSKTKVTVPPQPKAESSPSKSLSPTGASPEVISPRGDEEIMVVARASMVVDSPEAITPVAHKTLDLSSEDSPLVDSAQSASAPQKSLPVQKPQNTTSPVHSIKSVPIFGSLVEWLVAIPAGFLIVVILPRLFGFGFHASDFVDVITTQGIGRYSIVIELIVFWSIATVACVSLMNVVLRKFLDSRKLKKAPA